MHGNCDDPWPFHRVFNLCKQHVSLSMKMAVRPSPVTVCTVHRFKILPLSFKHLFTTASTAADSYWNVLQKNATKTTTLERTLTQIKENLDFSCVVNVLRRSCIDGHRSLGLRFFIWAGQQSNYRHSALIYNKASEILEITREPESLLDVIEAYKKEGSSVSIKAFKVILNLCRDAKLHNEALKILKKMEEVGCRPDTSSYNVVIRLFSEKNEMDVAKSLMDEMVSIGLYPDMITCIAMIKGFCNSNHLDDARAVFCDMRNHGCSPNAVVYSALLDGACKSGNLGMALELLGEMERDKNDCSKPNAVTYTSLIQNLCKKGRAKEALGVLDRMREKGCVPNWVAINTLMSGLCAEGCLSEAYGLIESMVGDGSSSSDRCYSSLVVCLLRMGDMCEAEKLIGKMLTSGIRPNGLACSSLIKEFCSKGRALDGFGWLFKVEKECVDPDVYLVLLLGLCQQSHLVEAAAVIGMMIERGVRVKDPNADAVVDELKKAGQDELALRLLGIGG